MSPRYQPQGHRSYSLASPQSGTRRGFLKWRRGRQVPEERAAAEAAAEAAALRLFITLSSNDVHVRGQVTIKTWQGARKIKRDYLGSTDTTVTAQPQRGLTSQTLSFTLFLFLLWASVLCSRNTPALLSQAYKLALDSSLCFKLVLFLYTYLHTHSKNTSSQKTTKNRIPIYISLYELVLNKSWELILFLWLLSLVE